jgi:hypothetical protein
MNSNEIVVKCCKCHRVCLNGDWKYIDRSDFKDSLYSHSVCPACLAEVHAEIEVADLFTNVGSAGGGGRSEKRAG